ncbi:hypothetical protein [Pseudarthrobacter chlorophenolicus]|uniref:hypothetical protein n=1 Tax=Pseudarthrobacter chlorophenolicus TaxID=85085 RepID=UPI000698BD5C|nr:hypothetical protein [Pseudarthrobacter chlorophenolicus]
MDSYPYSEWARLIGVPVEVRLDHRTVRSGVVDNAMPDSSAVWLAGDAAGGRELFTAADGYELWISPRQLGGRLCYKMAASQLEGAPRLG